MRATDVIIRKRDGHELSREQIHFILAGFLDGSVADYQMSALLMAALLKGLTQDEAAIFTEEMIASGDRFTPDELGPLPKIDKHSTGGVGDKVSLILAPLAAVCGVAVPMVSGRGLGHTGGTLDKLQAIPGFQIHLPREKFVAQVRDLGVAMIGQSDNFVPADKRLYALRDVTGTVESIPLICASILSKKAASGAQGVVLDVKVGSGAFMDTVEKGRQLGEWLREVGRRVGLAIDPVLTDMSQPLGVAVGNANEVRESIECLRGGGPADLREITIELTARMVALGEQVRQARPGEPASADTLATARRTVTDALDNGAALAKFRELVAAHGGDPTVVDNPESLFVSDETDEITATTAGFITSMNCREIGNAAVDLGAGRAKMDDIIDPSTGLTMLVRLGDAVAPGQALVRVHHRGGRGLASARRRIESAITIAPTAIAPPPLILS